MSQRITLVLPDDMYDAMVDLCNEGLFISVGEVARHYIRLGMKYEEEEEVSEE